jgi:23S rRNA pseudouridine2605 synthase
MPVPTPVLVRLNKFLAHAGVCSRREADRFIEEGRVRVNGRIVDELGLKIDPSRDRVDVRGRPVRPVKERPVFILLNKPPGYVATVKDPFGRPTVMDLLPRGGPRVYPVGRLDAGSEGALLFTNEGETAARLTHPRYGISKVYEVTVEGEPAEEEIETLRKGIFLEGRRTGQARIRFLRRGARRTVLLVEISEGRKREIRKIFEAVGYPVSRLIRVGFAGLTLAGLKPGQWRFLTTREIEGLRRSPRRSPAS